MKKKYLSILLSLAVLLALLLSACGSSKNDPTKWALVSFEYGGRGYTLTQFQQACGVDLTGSKLEIIPAEEKDAGMTAVVDIKNPETGEMHRLKGSCTQLEESGEYVVKGSGEELLLKPNKDNTELTMDWNGVSFIFELQPPSEKKK